MNYWAIGYIVISLVFGALSLRGGPNSSESSSENISDVDLFDELCGALVVAVIWPVLMVLVGIDVIFSGAKK